MIATAVDLVLVLLLLEAAALAAYHVGTGRGIAPRRLLGNLGAGFCLLLALRLNLATFGRDATWDIVTAAVLLLAFAAHLYDLAMRWES